MNNTDVNLIKEWLKQEPHLPDSWDEQWIHTCLRCCKFSLEKCKKKIDAYFTMRNAIPEYFTDRQVAKVKNVDQFITLAMMPDAGQSEAHRILIGSSKNTDFSSYSVKNMIKSYYMFLDARLQTGDKSSGDIYILDYSASYCTHILKDISLADMKKAIYWLQEAFPIRIKAIHCINVSPILHTLYNFVKPFLKEKLRNRIILHSNVEELLDHFSKEVLPDEFGGTAGSLESMTGTYWNVLEECQEWLVKTEGIKADETKRQGKRKDLDEVFGIDGSFRQLKID